jgi:hypothetical protein
MTELEELRHFVNHIATDYVELSQEKVAWQMHEYRLRAQELRDQYAHDDTVEVRFNDNF